MVEILKGCEFFPFFILQEIQQKSPNMNKFAIDIEIVFANLFLIFATLKTKTHKL